MEMSGQLHRFIALPPGKQASVHIVQEADWAPELVWTLRKKGKRNAYRVLDGRLERRDFL
jgi:hypothetical protein